jgi:hypothetical protein
MSLELFDQDDGVYANGEDDYHLEVYGYFRVTSPSMGTEAQTPCFSPLCEPTTYIANKSRYVLADVWGDEGHFIVSMVDPSTSFPIILNSNELCKSYSRYYCKMGDTYTNFGYQNNTVRVKVSDGEALTFEVNLMDSDEWSAHDQVCYIYTHAEEKTIEEWREHITNEENGATIPVKYVFTGTADDGGSCKVVVHVIPVLYHQP